MPADSTMARPMSAIQGNTPPRWRGRSAWSLWAACIGGPWQNLDKLRDLARTLLTLARPAVVRRRLQHLHDQGHIDTLPALPQLLVASQHQLSFSLAEDTRRFYAAQGIPWTSHNLRRFVAYPTTMMDPVGLFLTSDGIIQHVLQTFHRHATYDLVLLTAHPGGLASMQEQLAALEAGEHLHQASLDSLIEDGSYHDRLRRDVDAFVADPHVPARSIPDGLADDPLLMLAMDQFKDVRGYARYASRLTVGYGASLRAFVELAVHETVGGVFGFRVGPTTRDVSACDPDLGARHR